MNLRVEKNGPGTQGEVGLPGPTSPGWGGRDSVAAGRIGGEFHACCIRRTTVVFVPAWVGRGALYTTAAFAGE